MRRYVKIWAQSFMKWTVFERGRYLCLSCTGDAQNFLYLQFRLQRSLSGGNVLAARVQNIFYLRKAWRRHLVLGLTLALSGWS